MALGSRFIKKAIIPVIDLTVIILCLFLIAMKYQQIEGIVIPEKLLMTALPIYCWIWFITQVFVGGYDKPIKLLKNLLGAAIGTAIILMIYALLSKDYQFSRLIILLGGAFVALYYLVSRLILHNLIGEHYRIGGAKNKRFVIIGDAEEAERVNQILHQTNSKIQSVQFLSPSDEIINDKFIGTLSQLDQAIAIHKIDEVIFCAKNITAAAIINNMLQLEDGNIDFKIAQPETSFLIGSNSIDSQGDLYVMDINRINKPANRRNKRFLDMKLAFILLIFSPFLIWVFRSKKQFFKNMFGILKGKLSFVGYAKIHHVSNLRLPNIKKGILSSVMMVPTKKLDEEAVSRLNLIYAKNHSFLMDFKIIFKNFRHLADCPD
jgi:hypothetical protein